MNVVGLEMANQLGTALVGTKAYHLSSLMNQGFNVPNGFIVTTAAYRHYMQSYKHLGSKLREEDITLPEPLVQEIKHKYLTLINNKEGVSVAVRSSGSMEDLSEASFAGQYVTVLEVKTFEQLLSSIKKCWLCTLNDHVLEYLHLKNLDDKQSLSMAVLVQEMIHPRSAGVVFTRNPVNAEEDEIMINASIGLGEAVVSSYVTPDLFVISRSKQQLIAKELGEKESKLQLTEEGTQWIDTSYQERSTYCLSDNEALQVAQLALRIEHEQQYPVDVEFAVYKDNVFILQARPITVFTGGSNEFTNRPSSRLAAAGTGAGIQVLGTK